MCIRLYTKQTNIPRSLSSCHAPPLLDRAADSTTTLTDTYTYCAADIPNQNIWKGNLNTSRFCGLEVLPTDGDTFSVLIWASLGDSSIPRWWWVWSMFCFYVVIICEVHPTDMHKGIGQKDSDIYTGFTLPPTELRGRYFLPMPTVVRTVVIPWLSVLGRNQSQDGCWIWIFKFGAVLLQVLRCEFSVGHPSCCVAVSFIFVVELQFIIYRYIYDVNYRGF